MQVTLSPRILLVVAIIYFLSPLDLLPDILGPIGRIDDLVLLAFAAWRLTTIAPRRIIRESGPPPTKEERNRDPYEVFQLSPSATREEIEARYKELAKDYHPDRVAHLGEDLRNLAHEKMIEIQRAYAVLAPK